MIELVKFYLTSLDISFDLVLVKYRHRTSADVFLSFIYTSGAQHLYQLGKNLGKIILAGKFFFGKTWLWAKKAFNLNYLFTQNLKLVLICCKHFTSQIQEGI